MSSVRSRGFEEIPAWWESTQGFLFLFWGCWAFFSSVSPEHIGVWNAVPKYLSVACVLVSLFVFVLNNVCGWKKGNDIHFFENGCSAFIITFPNYIISVSVDNCFIRTYISKKGRSTEWVMKTGLNVFIYPRRSILA